MKNTSTYIEKTLATLFIRNLPEYFSIETVKKMLGEKYEEILGKEVVEKLGTCEVMIRWNPAGTFIRPENLYWIDWFFISSEPYQMELGDSGRNRWSGFVQFTVNSPIDDFTLEQPGGGSDDMLGYSFVDVVYNKIYNAYKRGTIYNGIRITKACNKITSATSVDEDCVSVPVRIYWEAYLEN